MKKLFTVILILTQLSVFSQDTTATQISDVERVVDKYVDKTAEALKGLAEALEVPAEHIYGVLITQQYVIAWSWIAAFIFGIFLLAVMGIYIYMGIKRNWDEVGIVFPAVIIGFIAIVFLSVGIAHASQILGGFTNPEYGAIKEISNLIK